MHRTQYFEMFGNRGIYHDGWYANTRPINAPWNLASTLPTDVMNSYKWELYDLTKDWTQDNDLAAANPAKLKEMQELFMVEAAKYQVFPLDDSLATRMVTPRPSVTAGRNVFTYSGELTGIPMGDAPQLLNTSYTITAEVEMPEARALGLGAPQPGDGMLATQGGRFGGWGFYVLKGKPVYVWNLLDLKRVRWEGAEALSPGKHTLEFDFKIRRAGLRDPGLQQHERHRPGRHGHAQSRRQGRGHPDDGAHYPAHPAVGRDFRHRRRHRHARWTTRTTRCRSASPASSTR